VRARVAMMGAQRSSKILGIFARLNARDGKPGYLKHLPRVETYMRQCLEHPALATLKPFYDQLLPEEA
jgi:aminoglycoside/choline kinase family phosphotransferase